MKLLCKGICYALSLCKVKALLGFLNLHAYGSYFGAKPCIDVHNTLFKAHSWQALASADTREDRTISQIDENVIKLNHYFCPSELEKAIDEWVDYYNEKRFHESLDNLTPKDVYLGQGEKIKKIREIIKQNSINKRIFDNKTMKHQSK